MGIWNKLSLLIDASHYAAIHVNWQKLVVEIRNSRYYCYLPIILLLFKSDLFRIGLRVIRSSSIVTFAQLHRVDTQL